MVLMPKQKKIYNNQKAPRLLPSKSKLTVLQLGRIGKTHLLVHYTTNMILKFYSQTQTAIYKNNMFWLLFPIHFRDPEMRFQHPSLHMRYVHTGPCTSYNVQRFAPLFPQFRA